MIVSFEAQRFLTLIKSNLSVFPFVANAFGIIFKKKIPSYENILSFSDFNSYGGLRLVHLRIIEFFFTKAEINTKIILK